MYIFFLCLYIKIKMAKSIWELVYELSINQNEIQKQLKTIDWKLESSWNKAGAKFWWWFSKWISSLWWLFSPINIALWAFTALTVWATNTFRKFEKTMDEVAAVSNATASEMVALNDIAKELWATTEFSAQQAGEWLVFLSTAWFTATQQLKAIWPVLNFATANNIDMAKSADIATNILSQFWKTVDELPQVMDILSKTTAQTNTDILQLSEAMKYWWPTAKAMWISLEEMSATIWVLSNNWLKWSLATRALWTSMTRLSAPTSQMKETMDKLWLSFFDAQWNFVWLAGTIKILENATKDMTQEQKQGTLATLFGWEAIQEWNILLAEWSDKLLSYTSILTDSTGETDRMAETMRWNMSWAIDNVSSAFEWLQIFLVEKFAPALTFLINWFADLVSTFSTAWWPLWILSDNMGKFLDKILWIERPITIVNESTKLLTTTNKWLQDQLIEIETQIIKNDKAYQQWLITQDELVKMNEALVATGNDLFNQYQTLQWATERVIAIEIERRKTLEELKAIEDDWTLSIDEKAKKSMELQVRLSELKDEEILLQQVAESMNNTNQIMNKTLWSLSTAKTKEEFETLRQQTVANIKAQLAYIESLRQVWLAQQKSWTTWSSLLTTKWKVNLLSKEFSETNKLNSAYNTLKSTLDEVNKTQFVAKVTTPTSGWGGKSATSTKKDEAKELEKIAKEEEKLAKELFENKIKLLEEESNIKKAKINSEITNEEERSAKILDIENKLKLDTLNLQGNSNKAILEKSNQRANLYDKIKDKAVETEKEINKNLDDSTKKLDDYNKKLVEIEKWFTDLWSSASESINSISKQLSDLSIWLWENLASRFAELQVSLSAETDQTKIDQLNKEKELIISNTTEEQRKEAVRQSQLSTSEKLIESAKQEKLVLEEQRLLSEQVLQAAKDKISWQALDTWFSTKVNEDTGVLEAFYIDSTWKEVQATNDKSAQYIIDTLNKQTELNLQLEAISIQIEEEKKLNQSLLDEKKSLAIEWEKFLEVQKWKEIALAEDLYQKWLQVYSMRQKAMWSWWEVTSRATWWPLDKWQTSFVSEKWIELFKSSKWYQVLPPWLFTPEISWKVINANETKRILNNINLWWLTVNWWSIDSDSMKDFFDLYLKQKLSGTDWYR